MNRVKRNGVYQRGKVWWIDYSYHGKRIREPAGQNKTEAKNMLDVRKADILRGEFRIKKKTEKWTFQEMVDFYLKEKAEKRSLRRDRTSLKHLIPEFEKYRIDQISSLDIEEYQTKRKKDRMPATVNRELALLRHMFNMAIKKGYLNWNPLRDVTFDKESPYARRVIYSLNDYERLWREAAPHLRAILITAIGTGLRKSDILGLKWENVDFDENLIMIIMKKTEEPVIIAMTPEVRQALWAIHEIEGKKYQQVETAKDYVFINPKTEKPLTDIKTAFRAALRRAGLKDRGYRFHDLRRTCASIMRKKDVPLLVIQKQLGHKSQKTTERYLNTDIEDMRKAASALSQAWFDNLKTRQNGTQETQALDSPPATALLSESPAAEA